MSSLLYFRQAFKTVFKRGLLGHFYFYHMNFNVESLSTSKIEVYMRQTLRPANKTSGIVYLLPKIPEKFYGIKNASLSNEKHDWSIRYHETHLIHVFINCLLILIFVTNPPYYSIDTRDISKPNYLGKQT